MPIHSEEVVMRGLVLLLVLLAALVSATTAPAESDIATETAVAGAAVVPPDLAGEHFETYSPESSVIVTSRTCDREGTSRLTFVASGPATGPYTGTFREEGTVTLGPHSLRDAEGNPIGRVLSFETAFTIESTVPPATVTGTKTLGDFPERDMIGFCMDRPLASVADQWSTQNQPLRYDAVIRFGAARFADAGPGRGGLYVNLNTVSPIYDARVFNEDFFTDLVPPVSLVSDQTIVFDALPDRTSIDPPFTVAATASSGLPVSFSVGPSDQCTISGDTVTITGVGMCTVTASQAGDDAYAAAPDVSRTFAINQAYPATRDECKIGGWIRYGVFANQGDCVSYVVAH
jgi:hypothetical protein